MFVCQSRPEAARKMDRGVLDRAPQIKNMPPHTISTKDMLSGMEELHQLSNENLLHLNIDRRKDLPKKKQRTQKDKEWQQAAVKKFFKTWMTAFFFKYGLDMLPAILTGKVFKNPSVLRRSDGRDTMGFALFFSSYLTIYKTVLWRMRSKKPSNDDQWNAFVAGSVAGLSILLDRNRDRRESMARTLFLRAIHFGSALVMIKWTQRIQLQDDTKAIQPKKSESTLVNRPLLSETKLAWEEKFIQVLPTLAPLLLLAVSTMTNIYALFLEPDCVESAYYKFLLNMSCFTDAVGPTWRPWLGLLESRFKELEHAPAELCMIPTGTSTRQVLSTHLPKELVEAVVPSEISHSYQLCAVLHPATSCMGNTWAIGTGAVTKAVKTYSLLYAVMTLIWHRKKCQDKPKESLCHYLKSVARSTAFLSLYTVIAANSVCLGRRVFGRERKLTYLLNGILASPAILLEQPGRRIEVILYIALRGLLTGWQLLLKRGLARRVPQWDTALFSLSMGVVMSVYQSQPEAVSKLYRGALDRVCGRE
ncbi:hypothetical protein BG003_003754 [Podila horticola]|nr:hypothetical protein BG003_003754 [Podila horticola]